MSLKRFVLGLTLVLFTVNMFTVSVYAACPHTTKVLTEKTAQTVPDCHKKQPAPEKKSSGHCKGVCLCQHAQFSPVFTLVFSETANIVSKFSAPPASTENPLISAAIAPIFRPPIFLS